MRTGENAEFINSIQVGVSQLLISLNNLLALRNEYLALGLTFQEIDFSAYQTTAGMTVTEFTAVLNSVIATDQFLAANSNAHYKNLYKIKRTL
jgi:hypothetical protein